MEIMIPEVAALKLTLQEPATLMELLAAGKKIPAEATGLLMLDHAEVKAMYRQHQSEDNAEIKVLLAGNICTALTVHALVEEEIFYPEVGRALEDDEMVTEAIEEHNEMKAEIAKIVGAMTAAKSTKRLLAKLMRIVEHHVKEEETEMFPDMRQMELDLYELGGQLAARRAEALLQLKRQTNALETQA